MDKNLRILFVEDLPTDHELAEWHLRKDEIIFSSICVDTQPAFVEALENYDPDLIISDYSMPAFNGLQALNLTLTIRPDIPFIILTGSINEETAVLCMKAGASDYVLKENMHRLPFSVRETLKRTQDRKEKILAEKRLQESEAKFRDIFESANVGKTITTPNELTAVNKAFADMVGYSQQELMKLSWQDITLPEDIDWINAIVGSLENGEQEAVRYDKRYIHKNGSFVWVDISVKVHRDQDGKPLYFISTIIDISEKKKAEERLRASEEQYRLLIENQSDMVVKVDGEGRFLYVSPSYCRVFGKNEAELIGEKFVPLVHEEDLLATLKAMESLKQPPHTGYIEQRALTKDGWRWLSWTDTAIMNDMGEITEIIGLGADITDRKQAEIALRESESKFRSLFHNNEAVMMLVDPESGNVIDINSAGCAFYGYSPDELINKPISEINILSPDEINFEIQKALNLESNYFVFRHRLKNGEIHDVEVFSSPIIHNGKTLLYSIVHDITDRRQAEKSLKESIELLEMFIQNSPIYAFIKEVNPSQSKVLMASENYSEMIGFSNAEMINKAMEELFPPEFAKKITADDWSVITEGKVLKLDEELNDRYYTSIKFPIFQGDKTLLAGYTIDVTEKKQAEVKLLRKIDELMRFQQVTVDRELKMIELKKEVNDLLMKLGLQEKYRIAE